MVRDLPAARAGRLGSVPATAAVLRTERRVSFMNDISLLNFSFGFYIFSLDPQAFLQALHPGAEQMVRDHLHHLPMFHDIVPVRKFCRKMEVLFDEQYGEAAA